MDTDIQNFAAVMAILVPSFAAVVATIVVAVHTLRRRDGTPRSNHAVEDERLARLEQAVDAIAVELERVGEGQRYLTQVMTQPLPAATVPAAVPEAQRGRTVTPH